MKPTIRPFVLILFATAFLAGCGGGGEDHTDTDAGSSPEMLQGQVYEVTTHDRVQSTGPEPALIEVTHELENSRRTVMLLEGSAALYQ